jgi:hypothetical protein
MDPIVDSGANLRGARRVHRIVVDVLATGDQVWALQDVIGAALCDGVLLHDGSCRIAWSLSYTAEPEDDVDDVSYGLDLAAVEDAYAHLLPIQTWPLADVDRSLGLSG